MAMNGPLKDTTAASVSSSTQYSLRADAGKETVEQYEQRITERAKSLFVEYGYTALNHVGEELCGDNVEFHNDDDGTTLVLADGLGSGVKANILSTLTSKILCTLVRYDVPIEECIETIIDTLPVDKLRGVAYSTFSVIHINNKGDGYLFEFDNPQAICYHDGRCMDLPRIKVTYKERSIYKSDLHLAKDDIVLVMSDGTIHAGVGQILNFGWERPEIIEHLNQNIQPNMSARCVANLLCSACNDLYLSKPGDDTTVAAVKLREELPVNLMVGPPVDKEKDDFYVQRFLSGPGLKVVCGGTSSQIVARYLKEPLKTSYNFPDKNVPPIGFIKGVDLVTEGVITLRVLLDLSEKYVSYTDLTPKNFLKSDGASLLADILFEKASSVTFFVGQNINKAHQGLPIDITMKMKIVERLADNLKKMGKKVVVYYD
ncbi:MAG: SpoIIE family protein phosphatase [Bacteroidales bacterium]|nr:SpoIIE family protein phosphatase [Bacteroidales bacterium]